MPYSLKKNDLRPSLLAVLTDGATPPAAVDLTVSGIVRLHAVVQATPQTTANLRINRAATVTSSTGGAVRYDFQEGDTAVPGTFNVEWEWYTTGVVGAFAGTAAAPTSYGTTYAMPAGAQTIVLINVSGISGSAFSLTALGPTFQIDDSTGTTWTFTATAVSALTGTDPNKTQTVTFTPAAAAVGRIFNNLISVRQGANPETHPNTSFDTLTINAEGG